MIKDLRYSLVVLFALISSLSFADAYKTLTFPEGNSEEISSYTATWTVTLDNFTWTIENFNNNKNQWAYVKCGRKNAESIGYITNSTVMDQAIGSVVVTIDALTASKVNSISLTVASDNEFANVVEKIEAKEIAKGDMTFKVTKPTANCYYKLTFDCQSGSSNGLVQVSKVSYYKEGDEPQIVDISNTPETAYTVAKAHELIAAGEGLTTDVYIRGIVYNVEEVSLEYGNATYVICDDATGQNPLKVYRGYYLNGDKFTAEDQIKVDDEVIVYGQLTVYKGENQVGQGNKLHSLTTGISDITADKAEGSGAIYNLAGQRIEKMQKGINIINGKKYVVK